MRLMQRQGTHTGQGKQRTQWSGLLCRLSEGKVKARLRPKIVSHSKNQTATSCNFHECSHALDSEHAAARRPRASRVSVLPARGGHLRPAAEV